MPKTIIYTKILVLLLWSAGAQAQAYSTAKPWAYWWWMGSAVDSANIKHQLQQFSGAGLGGVHIIPIYGVKGYEPGFIPFLSVQWLELLRYTVATAKGLGLGVDMTLGTGWPYGGPSVGAEHAAKKFAIIKDSFATMPTAQKVKRAAPGGEGLVLDHFNQKAVDHYLGLFKTLAGSGIRAVYNDSYEVYGANWTTDFLQEFKKRRGYDLGQYIKLFTDTTDSEKGRLVRMDYHQTFSELLHDAFTARWSAWAAKQKLLTRNQAHGSPGNLLDLYAQAAIPETESFGSSRFPIPGLRVDKNYEVDRYGTPDPLAMKFATSAANLTGKNLVSSETGTWLADHFKVSLSQVKPQVDELLAAGINHVFYHGITYAPKPEGFPGWLFYASTNFGPQSHLWSHLPLLNRYITRSQQLLQGSKPDNDILLYFPIHDLWATPPKGQGGVHPLEVHHTQRWLRPSAFGRLALQLYNGGWSFDYVSDLQLGQLKVTGSKQLQAGSSRYKVLVMPPINYLPLSTVKTLRKLAEQGVPVVVMQHLPVKVAGFHEDVRDFKKELDVFKRFANVTITANIEKSLSGLGAKGEGFSANGLRFIRKRHRSKTGDNAPLYFITNLDSVFSRGWVKVSAQQPLKRYDPLSNTSAAVPYRSEGNGTTEIYLELLPGQSCFLLNGDDGKPTQVSTPQKRWALKNPFLFRFIEGMPALASSHRLDSLHSWTTISEAAGQFYGTGEYTFTFALPDSVIQSRQPMLDLGQVHEVADVMLNGTSLGTAWCIPFQLRIPPGVLQRQNTLQVRVKNLSHNYMRWYDAQHPGWKKFYDINVVNIKYQPFDLSGSEAMPSGLTGRVAIYF